MKVKDIMTGDPVCCQKETLLPEAARHMVIYDCGELPVIENTDGIKHLVGVITDRDIVCRTIGQGLNPMQMSVEECFSAPAISINENASLEDCLRLMQDKQIRRVPVVDDAESLCGIVALADVTKYSTSEYAGEVLREVSIETGASSSILDKKTIGAGDE